jgi:hypothetical protein
LQTRGHQTITATDTANASILGGVTIKVRHGMIQPPQSSHLLDTTRALTFQTRLLVPPGFIFLGASSAVR